MIERWIGILLICISMLNNINVFAATRTFSTDATNAISTGDISISLNEYELSDNGDITDYVNNKLVVPGQRVDKIVVINNEAERSWIRAKVEYNTDDGLDGMSDEMLGGMPKEWKKCGNYFYYTIPVDKEKSIELFRSIVVPYEWDESYEDMGFSIGITAQAIQSSNFVPDFNSDEPWFGVPIEKCIHSDHKIYEVDTKNGFYVIFENGSEGFVRMGDDFFKNFNSLMPGDVVTDKIELGNNSNYYLKLFFSTETPEQSDESIKLLNDLKLVIKLNNEEIYNGSLNSDILRNEIRLGNTYRKGDRADLTYSIIMPNELVNSSAMKNAKVKWIFRAEYNVSSGGGGGGGTRSPGPSTSTINDNETPRIENDNSNTPDNGITSIDDNDIPLIEKLKELIMPNTGDDTHINTLYIIVIMSMILTIILIITERKSKNRKEDKDEQS